MQALFAFGRMYGNSSIYKWCFVSRRRWLLPHRPINPLFSRFGTSRPLYISETGSSPGSPENLRDFEHPAQSNERSGRHVISKMDNAKCFQYLLAPVAKSTFPSQEITLKTNKRLFS